MKISDTISFGNVRTGYAYASSRACADSRSFFRDMRGLSEAEIRESKSATRARSAARLDSISMGCCLPKWQKIARRRGAARDIDEADSEL
jgi:hypothetical protein